MSQKQKCRHVNIILKCISVKGNLIRISIIHKEHPVYGVIVVNSGSNLYYTYIVCQM